MKTNKGFSLVEVVVAVGLFAFAVVGVIGLLAPTNRAISDVTDNDAASRAISSIQDGLQRAGFSVVQGALTTNSPPAEADFKFAASKNGQKVGLKAGGTGSPFSNAQVGEQFFEFALVRNTTLSPNSGTQLDANSGYLAFYIVLRWPAYLPNGAVVSDSTQKNVLVVPAAVTR